MYTRRRILFKPVNLLKLSVAALLGLSPYVYLWASAMYANAPLTWGDQRTLGGFLKHFLRQEYGTFDLANRGDNPVPFFTKLQLQFSALAHESLFLSPVLGIVGLSTQPRSAFTRLLVTMFAVYVFFFNWRANLDIHNVLLAGVQERFWLQPSMIAAVFAGLGFSYVSNRFKFSQVLSLGIGGLLICAQVGRNLHERDESHNTAVRDFGKTLLEHLPENSILLTMGDLVGNSARYVQHCENVRPDVRLIDLEMMTFEWYLAMLEDSFPGVVFPATTKVYRLGAEFFSMRTFLDANIDRFDIFVFDGMNPEDNTWQDVYELRHYGLPDKIVRKNSKFNPTEWRQAMKMIPQFPLPPNPERYDNRTWERVVIDGYYSAGVKLAIEFNTQGEKLSRSEEKKEAFGAALEIYEKLFATMPPPLPVFWHKNFGLAALNMLRATNDKQYQKIVTEHWHKYIDSSPDDPQIAAMQQVLSQMSTS
eukprot:m.229359 g.229359  ORF g.229359 m.229359 type:complete len:477 (+) comp26440_c0_seq1:751-2181(+)